MFLSHYCIHHEKELILQFWRQPLGSWSLWVSSIAQKQNWSFSCFTWNLLGSWRNNTGSADLGPVTPSLGRAWNLLLLFTRHTVLASQASQPISESSLWLVLGPIRMLSLEWELAGGEGEERKGSRNPCITRSNKKEGERESEGNAKRQ